MQGLASTGPKISEPSIVLLHCLCPILIRPVEQRTLNLARQRGEPLYSKKKLRAKVKMPTGTLLFSPVFFVCMTTTKIQHFKSLLCCKMNAQVDQPIAYAQRIIIGIAIDHPRNRSLAMRCDGCATHELVAI